MPKAPKVTVTVQNNIVAVKYRQNNRGYEYEWEDHQDLTQKFLLCLDKIFDKINNCNKNEINCLFKSPTKLKDKSESQLKPIFFELHRKGGNSTTWRIVCVSLRALAWAGKIKLKLKMKSEG